MSWIKMKSWWIPTRCLKISATLLSTLNHSCQTNPSKKEDFSSMSPVSPDLIYSRFKTQCQVCAFLEFSNLWALVTVGIMYAFLGISLATQDYINPSIDIIKKKGVVSTFCWLSHQSSFTLAIVWVHECHAAGYDQLCSRVLYHYELHFLRRFRHWHLHSRPVGRLLLIHCPE